MTRVRRALIPVAVVAAAVGGVVTVPLTSSATTPAAAPVVHSITIAGTDTHSLDPQMQPMFVDGGGVMPVFEDIDDPITYRYLEAGLDLPVGAKVTSIAASMTGCYKGSLPKVVVGSYQPTTGNTIQNATLNINCAARTVTKTGNPIFTTVAGRRYVADFVPGVISQYPGVAVHDDTFFGTTIKYTCTSPCVP